MTYFSGRARKETNKADESAVLFDESPIRWLLLAAGVASVLFVIKTRQPPTTSDFTVFYQSAAHPVADMYKGLRVNLNPPHFTLLIEPLTWLPMNIAAEVWRALSVLSLCGCLWWLGTRSDERWSVADVGAALAWAPFHHVFTLNQVTWIMWPMLIAAWWQWRQDRWIEGAVWFGLALSFKSFLGVVLIWLAFRGQWRAIAVSLAVSAAAFAAGILAYGPSTFVAWTRALAGVTWSSTWTNASFAGLFGRLVAVNNTGAAPLVDMPAVVAPLVFASGVALVLITCIALRHSTVDESWPPLIAAALLASPLGWVYYAWWMLPGTKPSRLLVRSPLLWMPMVFLTRGQPSPWATLTLASMYAWGLLIAWAWFLSPRQQAPRPLATAAAVRAST